MPRLGLYVDSTEKAVYLANAHRLLDDARYLMKDRRWASAYFISVIACEEIGKMILVELNQIQPIPNIGRMLRDHSSKQIAFGHLIMGDLLAQAIEQSGQLVGAGGKLQDIIPTIVKRHEEYPKWDIMAAVTSLIQHMIKTDEHSYIVGLANFGLWQNIKHLSIYSDISIDENDKMTEGQAVSMTKAVERAFRLLTDQARSIPMAMAAKSMFDHPDNQAIMTAAQNTKGGKK